MGKGAAAGVEAEFWAGSAGCGVRLAKKLFSWAGEGAGWAGAETGLADAGGVEGRIPVDEGPGLPKGVKVIGAAGDGDGDGAADAANMGLAAGGAGAAASAGGPPLAGETIIFGIVTAGAATAARAGAEVEAPLS